MARVRTVDFLPEIFQTPVNRQFLSATLDQLVQEPSFKKTQGYVGRRVGPGVKPEDRYVIEPTASRTNYQLEPGVIQIAEENSKAAKPSRGGSGHRHRKVPPHQTGRTDGHGDGLRG